MKKLFLSSCMAVAFASSVSAESVTVGTSGADFTSLTAAVIATGGTINGEPNIITFIDEGPFYEANRIIINVARTGPDDMIIQAAEGVRPIIIVDMEASASKVSAVHLRKQGNLTVKDLIIIPPSAGVVDTASYDAKVAEAGIEMYVDNLAPTSITLENILISSNDGNDQPIASLDGLTPPVFDTDTISFHDEGIYIQSQNALPREHVHYLNMTDVVVSGIAGPDGSDGIRGFPDGAPGSEWIIGPGTTISYNRGVSAAPTISSASGAFQPGGTEGFAVRVQGTEENPVRLINNNASGIYVTNTTDAVDGLVSVEWAIIANNTGAGIVNGDVDSSTVFQNVTFANNDLGVLYGPPNPDAVTYTFSNVIAAGTGDTADDANAINVTNYGTTPAVTVSAFTAADSAIVLAGPYSLNTEDYDGDGINSDSKYVVTTTNFTNADPQFASLDPLSPSFAVVTNTAYETAGPLGQPLVGGGSYSASSISNWQLF